MTQRISFIRVDQFDIVEEERKLVKKERRLALYFALACLTIISVMTYAILHIEVYAPL